MVNDILLSLSFNLHFMKNTFKQLFCLAIAIFAGTLLYAVPVVKNTAAKSAPLSFIENKGQVADQNNKMIIPLCVQ